MKNFFVSTAFKNLDNCNFCAKSNYFKGNKYSNNFIYHRKFILFNRVLTYK